jgi:hypothetical protein
VCLCRSVFQSWKRSLFYFIAFPGIPPGAPDRPQAAESLTLSSGGTSHQIIFSTPPDFPFSQAGIKYELVSQVCVTPPRATARGVDPYETTPMSVSDDNRDATTTTTATPMQQRRRRYRCDDHDTDATTTTATPTRRRRRYRCYDHDTDTDATTERGRGAGVLPVIYTQFGLEEELAMRHSVAPYHVLIQLWLPNPGVCKCICPPRDPRTKRPAPAH